VHEIGIPSTCQAFIDATLALQTTHHTHTFKFELLAIGPAIFDTERLNLMEALKSVFNHAFSHGTKAVKLGYRILVREINRKKDIVFEFLESPNMYQFHCLKLYINEMSDIASLAFSRV